MIEYVNWDFEAYCKDCKDLAVGHGDHDEREDELAERWPHGFQAFAHVNKPMVFADPTGRIIAWILPSIIPTKYQVSLSDYTFTRNQG